MLKVALTGGICTGKTWVRARFTALGVPAIDADELVHTAYHSAPALASRIGERFGPDVLTVEGFVDRRRLGAVVFADPAARRDLEALIHPVVFEAIDAWFADLERLPGCPWALAEVPLLFETGRAGSFGKVIVVACAPDEQVRRVMARDGLSEADARTRLDAQWPVADKVARADFTVWSDRGLDDTDAQVTRIYRTLTALGTRPA
jgi:dephospho-CoA kinase